MIRPSTFLSEAHIRLLPFWRCKIRALDWLRFLVGLEALQCEKNFRKAYRELAAIRWNRYMKERRDRAATQCAN
jgi:hypothetical protein